ncbi:MAG TPA: TatD family hydrolase [Candidatus Paceibacterota bacterium]|nr:TatD family hydrolase [Candidatus Paceibacterota bacterium]
MKYFDAHAHVQFPPYDADKEEILQKMQEQDVGAIMVGVDYASSERAIALVEGCDDLYASVGLHPNDNTTEVFDIEKYRALAAHSKVIAIGECGLDYYRQEESDKGRQKELFLKHVDIATSLDKPLIIHARPTKGTQNAYQDLIEILTEKKAEHGDRLFGDVHFFVGGVEEAQALVALGFTLSFTAVLTFTKDYDEVIRSIPLTAIISETDAPYVAPEGRRGTRNDPLAVIDVVGAIARIRGEEQDTVRAAILENARRVFRL